MEEEEKVPGPAVASLVAPVTGSKRRDGLRLKDEHRMALIKVKRQVERGANDWLQQSLTVRQSTVIREHGELTGA
jgi:hypothetical protein